MDLVHLETYKGYEIKIYVLSQRMQNDGYIGRYEICVTTKRAQHDVIKGDFVIAQDDAQQAALDAAKRWIDDQNP